MASKYRKIDPRMWRDERFIRLTFAEQYVAVYCIAAQSNRCGIFLFSVAMAAEELKLPQHTFLEHFRNVVRTLRWEWDGTLRVLYLPTWWKYNPPENGNVLAGNLADLRDLPASPLVGRFLANVQYLKSTYRIQVAKRWRDIPVTEILASHLRPEDGADLNVLGNVGGNVTGDVGGNGTTQEQEQEQEQDIKSSATQNSCSEPAEPASEPEPPLLTFNCSGKPAEWHLHLAKLEEWESAFPGVDVLAEAKKARQWMVDNPTKRKTAKGMTKFLNSWLARAQDRPAPQRAGSPVTPVSPPPLRALTPFETKHVLYDPHNGAKRDAAGNFVFRDCGDPACDHCAARRKGAAA